MRCSTRDYSRWILIFLVPVAALILFPFDYLNSSSFDPSSLLFRASIFSSAPLATAEWLYAFSGRIQLKKLLLLFFVGTAATVGSAFHSTPLPLAGWCGSRVSGGGFPLPWYLRNIPFSDGLLPACPRIVAHSYGSFALFSFLFDVIFYAAFAIVGTEFYRWANGRNAVKKLPTIRESQEKRLQSNLEVYINDNIGWATERRERGVDTTLLESS